MIYLKRPGWFLPDHAATDEPIYWQRRLWLKKMGVAGAIAATAPATLPSLFNQARADESLNPWTDLYPALRHPEYKGNRPLTREKAALEYNNFYEFGSHKAISNAAQKMKTHPWTIQIDGMVEEKQIIDFDQLVRSMPLEERIYRHRCVEAWAMTVPWSGFEMSHLIKLARPLSSARYVSFETLADPDTMPGLAQPWYPWPYLEGVTIDEAMNPLCFMATGLYGKPIPKQNGAPIRLVLPWKYGFKSIKSIVKIMFTRDRPVSFWEQFQPAEYGFWANVNPDVSHPRWSQRTEKLLGTNDKVPTQIYNGYGEYVASLYSGMPQERSLFI